MAEPVSIASTAAPSAVLPPPPDKPAEDFVVVRDLTAAYGDMIAVEGVSMSLSRGEHLSLLGPSGCGKTTTLRCVAGLERPISGEILIDGRVVYSSAGRGVFVPPEKRNLSMVFQSYAIWPHMTVFENVAYGLRLRKMRGQVLRQRVMAALELVGLDRVASNRATALSGGQQQRVALARSYVTEPKALLLDEPLSNLDARLRVRMRDELQVLQRRLGVTTLYVTHDQEEAMSLSDRIVVMEAGRICQYGTPAEIYSRPATAFVADFVGAANLYPGVLSRDADGWLFRTQGAQVRCAGVADAANYDQYRQLAVRPVFPSLHRSDPHGRGNVWPSRISRRVWHGDLIEYVIDWPGGTMRVRTAPTVVYDEGDQVFLEVSPEHAIPVR